MRLAGSYRSARRNLLRGMGALRAWRKGPFYALTLNPRKPKRTTCIHATAQDRAK